MKIVNLTPHAIVLSTGDQIQEFPPAGPAPRLAIERNPLGSICGIDVVQTTMGGPTGLPAEDPDVILVVSALVAEHPSLAGRRDLAYPGEAIRDESGRVVAARGLCAGPGLTRRLEEESAGRAAGRAWAEREWDAIVCSAPGAWCPVDRDALPLVSRSAGGVAETERERELAGICNDAARETWDLLVKSGTR